MKETKNPWVIQTTKDYFKRACPVSSIPYIIRDDGSKGCIWCGDDLKTKHHMQRYCKDKRCPISANMWSYPQSNESCFFILEKQEFKCNLCCFNYRPYFEEILDQDFYNRQGSFNYIKTNNIPLQHRPEVDHIKAIIQGGQSLGLDNHQVICYTCHKEKTKSDVKGPRRIKSQDELLEQRDKKIINKIHDKLGPFLDIYYASGIPIEESFRSYREIFLTNLSIEELEAKERQCLKRGDFNPEDKFQELKWIQEVLSTKKINSEIV